MIESLESRQLLSATLAGEALRTSDPAPSTAIETDAVVEKAAKGASYAGAHVLYQDVVIPQ
jgi:hypothetical protein